MAQFVLVNVVVAVLMKHLEVSIYYIKNKEVFVCVYAYACVCMSDLCPLVK